MHSLPVLLMLQQATKSYKHNAYVTSPAIKELQRQCLQDQLDHLTYVTDPLKQYVTKTKQTPL